MAKYTGIWRRADASRNALLGRTRDYTAIGYKVTAAGEPSPCGDWDMQICVFADTAAAGIGGGRSAQAYGQFWIHRTVGGRWLLPDKQPGSCAFLLAHRQFDVSYLYQCQSVFSGRNVLELLFDLFRFEAENRAVNALLNEFCGRDEFPQNNVVDTCIRSGPYRWDQIDWDLFFSLPDITWDWDWVQIGVMPINEGGRTQYDFAFVDANECIAVDERCGYLADPPDVPSISDHRAALLAAKIGEPEPEAQAE